MELGSWELGSWGTGELGSWGLGSSPPPELLSWDVVCLEVVCLVDAGDLCVISVGSLSAPDYLKGILGFGVSGGCPGNAADLRVPRAT